MSALIPENLLTAWARLLIDSLASAGVRNVIVSPGSRSTPFVLAAAAQPQLRLWDVIDERSAAFFALGQARVTGMPSALLCTSGSAAAHYLPAVIEADQAGVPMLIVTADRPTELLHVAANQTIDQRMLFQGYARRIVDVGTPDPAPSALRGVRRLAAQAVALTRAPQPGAVHLNLRARKPLEPAAARTPAAQELETTVQALLDTPIPQVIEGRPMLDGAAIEALALRCARARRGMIVAGPAPASQVRARAAVARLVQATGFVLIAEAASQLRFTGGEDRALIDAADWLHRLPTADADWRPDLIVQLGVPPTSGLLEQYREVERIVVSPIGWPDPHGGASTIVHGEIGATCARLATAVERMRPERSPSEYATTFAVANARARSVIDAPAEDEALTEGAIAQLVAARLPTQAWLALGNSLPIRTVDEYCAGALANVRVLSQRGASGIDGLVSGAAGASSVADEPVALLVGDISALHDIGGFSLGGFARVPLAIVVINNGGGRIFEQLPVARVIAAEALRHFTTPHSCDFEHAARLYGHPFARVRTRRALADALSSALGKRGCTLIEAVVPPHSAAEDRRRILAALQ